MQDDVYMITADGWCAAARLRPLVGAKSKEKPDFVVGKFKYNADLIPPALVVLATLPRNRRPSMPGRRTRGHRAAVGGAGRGTRR